MLQHVPAESPPWSSGLPALVRHVFLRHGLMNQEVLNTAGAQHVGCYVGTYM
eukprot:m.35752 g.35752  ORF g.35752 m.35752 type:complete len:52 (-) comp14430_c0_seq10:31-186(-)